MMAAQRSAALRGVLRQNESMARHTTWRVGGPADRFYEPADLQDLAAFLQTLAPNEPLLWLGLGSNLLVRDGGIRGTVISTAGALNELVIQRDGTVRAEAGVPCAKVARFCANNNRVGAEFFAGIPGTMGGALAMNAGAFGGETWRLVRSVETLDRYGTLRTRAASEFEVGYRHVKGPAGEWFVAAHLTLESGDGQAAKAQIKQWLDRRNTTQPTGVPSCGSVFRNPAGDYAGRLIEASGLKGYCIGGACVSEKHANFIINTGAATASDIEKLIAHVARVVHERQGADLKAEVHIVGESIQGAG